MGRWDRVHNDEVDTDVDTAPAIRALTGRRAIVVTLIAVVLAVASPAVAGCRDRASAATAHAVGTSTGSLRHGGLTRHYRIHLPPQSPANPSLVVALHGGLGDGADMAWLSGFDALSDEAGFVVVYPDGVGRSWADGRRTVPADRRGIDDVGFLAALITAVQRADGTDPARVYVTGMSNGAFMAQRLACERADLVTAVAPVEGTLSSAVPCRPSRPVSLLAVHGTDDPIVPYGGGTMTGRGGDSQIRSAPQATAMWRAADGCRTDPVSSTPHRGSDGTSVTVTRAVGCPAGVDVSLWAVNGGGHTWPGGPQYLPRSLVGRTSNAFAASRVIWDFFAAHTTGTVRPRTGPRSRSATP